MTSAAVTSVTSYVIAPPLNRKLVFVTYTKANVGDTIDMSSYGLSTIDGVIAMSASGVTQDPATWSSTTITFTAGTGVGFAYVVGN